MGRGAFWVLCLAVLGGCAGGSGGGGGGADVGGGGAGGGPGVNPGDYVAFFQSDVAYGGMTVDQMPSASAEMQGAMGARLGWTNRALIGAAHVTADFEHAFISGYVDQVGLYSVSTDLALMQTTPLLESQMQGVFTLAGTMNTSPGAGEPVSFTARYGGMVSGVTNQEPVEFTLDGVTYQGVFLAGDGAVYLLGQLDGVVVRRHPGGHAIEEVLREGRIIAQQVP